MDYKLLEDIIEWDISNWSRSLEYWDKRVILEGENLKCLEIGGRSGGLSLWLALKGNEVICSDINDPTKLASAIHKKYNINKKITYQEINALEIPYENYFDLIVFKSILGGISRGDSNLKKKTLDEIHKALKDGGKLLFAENMESSIFHKLLRKMFISWAKDWNYLNYSEVKSIFSSFKKIDYIAVGFLAAFGRTEKQRFYLGKLDKLIEKFIPDSKKYILIGIAEK